MSTVTIKLLANKYIRGFFGSKEETYARDALLVGGYESCVPIYSALTGKDAAEEMFDLTNNPDREEERQFYYGDKRSLSSGDIVNVDGVDYLCLSMGWLQLD
jgi:hypothetical protein